jgi:hypothetical protein
METPYFQNSIYLYVKWTRYFTLSDVCLISSLLHFYLVGNILKRLISVTLVENYKTDMDECF